MTVTEVDTIRTPDRCRFLADVIVTAIEGGIGYWSATEQYRWWFPDLDGGTADHEDGKANAYATIVDLDDGRADEETGTRYELTLDKIEEALGKFRAGTVKQLHESYIRSILANDRTNGDIDDLEDEDVSDIDAELADAIVQVACFGEVIYG